MDCVVVPKQVYEKYFRLPFSVLVAAAETATDGLTLFSTDQRIHKATGCSVFRKSEQGDGFDRDDVAVLHTHNW